MVPKPLGGIAIKSPILSNSLESFNSKGKNILFFDPNIQDLDLLFGCLSSDYKLIGVKSKSEFINCLIKLEGESLSDINLLFHGYSGHICIGDDLIDKDFIELINVCLRYQKI